METQRAFAAIVISLVILFTYQYFFMPPPPPANVPPADKEAIAPASEGAHQEVRELSAPSPQAQEKHSKPQGRDIKVETKLYSATVSENGGAIKSFKLHDFKETNAKNSPAKELITSDSSQDLPLLFNWGKGPAPGNNTLYRASQESVDTRTTGRASLTMESVINDLHITRTMTFSDSSYLIGLDVVVHNGGLVALKGSPNIGLINRPFAKHSGRYLFNGPAVLLNDELQEIKNKEFKEAPKTVNGSLDWAAFEDSYFFCGIIPANPADHSVSMRLKGEDTVQTNVAGPADIIAPGAEKRYHYNIYFGPKKLKTLKETGYHLDRAVNFGFFDIIAKPTLYLLNFLHNYLHNYGIAIILVTILFKLIFWPISHKGMKSMKNMQKIQPKMAKLREKYKDDKERLNQEMITLYKTYKVNPLGGCLPMVLQIPVFFALYKVLLQTIELRHAPFMLWITDLSAPDRLYIGVHIPVLGGIPVLTLLMGASMFLQQKMTPSTGDPTQAKMMMFLPIVFTFMFINFASGLVLYWFINNLLSVGQQYYINRSVDA